MEGVPRPVRLGDKHRAHLVTALSHDLILPSARHAKLERTTVRDALYLRGSAAVVWLDEKVNWLQRILLSERSKEKLMRCATCVHVGSDALIRGYGMPWDKELVDQVTHFNHNEKDPIKEESCIHLESGTNAPVCLTKQQPSLLCARLASFTMPHERTSICNAAAKSSSPFSSTLLPAAPPLTFDPASCYE